MSNPRSRRAAPRFSSGHAIHAKQHGFTGKTVSYDTRGVEGVDPFVAADLTLTTQIAAVLERHYPAHPWMVEVTHAQGVAMICLPILMKRNQKFVLKIAGLKCDPGLRAVVRAGGEILERYNVPRHGFSLTSFLEAREKGPYVRKPKPRLLLPEFASSARPESRLVIPAA